MNYLRPYFCPLLHPLLVDNWRGEGPAFIWPGRSWHKSQRPTKSDYIEIAPSSSGEKYSLMLRDDHSDYKWLFAFADTSAGHASRATIDWAAAFGVPNGLISDSPTHFKNATVHLVANGLRVPHHFTLPYKVWSNGAIERLGKDLLRVFHSVASELQIRSEEWPELLPVVHSALNNAPSPHRAYTASVSAFTGMYATPPVSTLIRSSKAVPVTVTGLQRERAFNSEDLKAKIAELHPCFQDVVVLNRRRMQEARSSGSLPNFVESDYILVSREAFTAAGKLSLRWQGPR